MLNIKKLATIVILLTVIVCSKNLAYSSLAQSQFSRYATLFKENQMQPEQRLTTYKKKIEQQSLKLNGSQSDPLALTAYENPLQQQDLSINKDDIVLGNRNSKVVVVEYFSFTCAHCAYFKKKVLPEIKKNYIDNNKIAYVIREFIASKQDLDASILARCSNNKDSFFKFIDILLEQQDNWAFTNKYKEILTNIGKLGGVTEERYANCLHNEQIIRLLISNTRAAAKAPNFLGTPGFFINGVLFSDPYNIEDLFKHIDEALSNLNSPK